jgi:hypothetical protein
MEQMYTLELSIAEPALARLEAAGWVIVVAKAAGGKAPNVAWLAARAKARTTIRWEERYGVFASETALRCGAEVDVRCLVYPAHDRHVYPYAGGRFGPPVYEAGVPHGHYDVRNDHRAAVTFGLLQSASIDSRPVLSPLNAVVLPADFRADFTAVPRLYVWAQPAAAARGILTEVPAGAATIEFDGARPAKSCRYDGDATAFVEA